VFDRMPGTNPDDPDCDAVESAAWWNPADLPGNPVVRPELLADIDAVMAALGCGQECCGAECCSGACCGGASGCPCGATYCGPAEVAKAGDEKRPKVPPAVVWPGWALDRKTVAYWAPLLTAALSGALSATQAQQLASAYLEAFPPGQQDGQGKSDAVDAAAAWLAAQGLDLTPALQSSAAGIVADGWLIGGVSAAAMADGTSADTGGWKPGDRDKAAAVIGALGLGDGLGSATGSAPAVAGQMAAGYMTVLGRALVDGASAGLAAKAIGAALVAAVADVAKAAAAVLGQLVQAVADAAHALYGQRGVTLVDIINGPNPCPECAALAESNPHAPGLVPIHPNCECVELIHQP
jgi:hypothetical protein